MGVAFFVVFSNITDLTAAQWCYVGPLGD